MHLNTIFSYKIRKILAIACIYMNMGLYLISECSSTCVL